ncbi:MAG TPA: serine/threonine-protein kinase [Candidatus Acidoferrum sp.]|nr:serine/threonine-protein kinase [Candidatus Acidoferrum sp.]
MSLQVGDRLPELGYELAELIREGGHAFVYRATHPTLTPKAVKVLKPGMRPDIVEGFLREGQLLDKFDHPHIIRGHHVLKIGPELVIVMQYADGGSLADLLAKQRMPINDVIKMTRSIGYAIDYAHRQGVLVLDINPANILRVAGKWVISDFGIAVYDSPNLLLPSAHGTPGYLAPEIRLRKPVKASDIFALGCVVYQALCGLPVDFGSVKDLLGPDPAPRLPPDPSVPEAARDVLAQALEKDASQRFATASEFAEALRVALVGRKKVVKSSAPLPSTIQAQLLLHIGAAGRPRQFAFSPDGKLLLWTVGQMLCGHNLLTQLYLQGGSGRGIYLNETVEQIEFAASNQAWFVSAGRLRSIQLDAFVSGKGDDVVMPYDVVRVSEQIGHFARSANDLAVTSQTSPTIWLYAYQGNTVGRLRVMYRIPDEHASITAIAWQGTDIIFSTTSVYEGSGVYRWVDAHLADSHPLIIPLSSGFKAAPFEKRVVFERLAVEGDQIAAMTKEEIHVFGKHPAIIRPGGTLTDMLWFREFVLVAILDRSTNFYRVELYDAGGDLRFEFPPQPYKSGGAQAVSLGIYKDVIAFSAKTGIDFFRVS